MARKIFTHKKGEVREQFSIFHNERLHELYSPPIIVKIIK
jgi:hypothetical protein